MSEHVFAPDPIPADEMARRVETLLSAIRHFDDLAAALDYRRADGVLAALARVHEAVVCIEQGLATWGLTEALRVGTPEEAPSKACWEIATTLATLLRQQRLEGRREEAGDALAGYRQHARSSGWDLPSALTLPRLTAAGMKLSCVARQLRELGAEDEAGTRDVDTPEKPPHMRNLADVAPRNFLFGWPEILTAVGQKNNKEAHNRVRRLNDTREGPIKIHGQGSHPIVDKAELLEWWNRLHLIYENDRNSRDAKANTSDTFGDVAPSIAGSVKRRRKDRKP